MKEPTVLVQTISSKSTKFLTSVTLLSKFLTAVLFITIPFVGFYLGFKYQNLLSSSFVSSGNSANTTTTSSDALLSDIKKLTSEIIVSDVQPKFAVYLRRRDNLFDYSPFGQDSGGSLSIDEDLVILNLESGERKIYEFSQGLIPIQVVEFLKPTTPEGGSHYRLFPQLLRWAPLSKNVFWGKLSIYSNGDPPIANEVSFFKMDINKSKIDNFAVPNHGLFGAVNENTNAEKVLYESVGDGLSLYEYNMKSGKDKLIISYSKEIFDQYCASSFEYVYTSGFYGDCGRDRGLRAEWEKEGITYFDFITGKKINLATD